MKNYLLIFIFGVLSIQLLSGQSTQLNTASCNITLTSLQQDLYVDIVPNATNYQYHITNAALGFDKYWNRGSGSNIFRLGWINGILYNETYQVEVRPYVNGSWGSWGIMCSLTTPTNIPSTKLSNAYCGITLNQMTDLVYCDAISGAIDYEYRVINAAAGFSKLYRRGSGSNAFSLAWVSGVQFNTTYDVEVRANINGNWGNFGAVCQLTTPLLIPLTQLDANSCGKTLSSINETVYCDPVANATNYQYRIINASLGFNTTYIRGSGSTAFSLSWVSGINYGYTYDIEVRSYVNGNWSSYGPMCQLIVPAIPVTQIMTSYCGLTYSDVAHIFYAESVVGATNYEYRIINDSINYNQSYFRNSSSNAFSLNWVPGIIHGHTYDVQVRAYANNTWGNFGNTCQLTVIPIIKMNPSSCGIQLNEMTDVLYTAIVPNATKYQYNVYNTSLGENKFYTRDIQYTCCPSAFTLNMINGILWETQYKIRVRVQVNNIWGEYGEDCDLLSPVFPHTSFIPTHCNITLNTINDLLEVSPVYNASNYEYSISEPITNWKSTYHRNSGSWLFSLGWINGIQPSTTYEISVKAYSNGMWGPDGTVCTVTTPSTFRINNNLGFSEDYETGEIEIYPNPSSNINDLKFKFSPVNMSKSNSNYSVTGIRGNLIYEGEISASEYESFRLPSYINLNPGIYIIKISHEGKIFYKKFTIL